MNILQREFRPKCKHNSFSYDYDTRKVWCSECEKVLDPIAVAEKIFAYARRLEDKLAKHQVEITKIEKRKRVKCKHCKRFTDLNMNLNWDEVYQEKLKINAGL